ncbi:hypothetical protein, partial [Enterobacter hormaechei]
YSAHLFSASAISHSALGKLWVNAFTRVDDASPKFRETAESDIPRFFSAAIIPAEYLSGCIMIMPPPHHKLLTIGGT